MGPKEALRLLPLAVLMLAGCATVHPHFAPATFDPGSMEVVGEASATVRRYFSLASGPNDSRDLATAAVAEAAKKAGGDTLVNVVADHIVSRPFYPFYQVHTLTVRGTAVRYKKKP